MPHHTSYTALNSTIRTTAAPPVIQDRERTPPRRRQIPLGAEAAELARRAREDAEFAELWPTLMARPHDQRAVYLATFARRLHESTSKRIQQLKHVIQGLERSNKHMLIVADVLSTNMDDASLMNQAVREFESRDPVPCLPPDVAALYNFGNPDRRPAPTTQGAPEVQPRPPGVALKPRHVPPSGAASSARLGGMQRVSEEVQETEDEVSDTEMLEICRLAEQRAAAAAE